MDTDELVPDDDLVGAVGEILGYVALAALAITAGAVAGVAQFCRSAKRASREQWPHP